MDPRITPHTRILKLLVPQREDDGRRQYLYLNPPENDPGQSEVDIQQMCKYPRVGLTGFLVLSASILPSRSCLCLVIFKDQQRVLNQETLVSIPTLPHYLPQVCNKPASSIIYLFYHLSLLISQPHILREHNCRSSSPRLLVFSLSLDGVSLSSCPSSHLRETRSFFTSLSTKLLSHPSVMPFIILPCSSILPFYFTSCD